MNRFDCIVDSQAQRSQGQSFELSPIKENSRPQTAKTEKMRPHSTLVPNVMVGVRKAAIVSRLLQAPHRQMICGDSIHVQKTVFCHRDLSCEDPKMD